MTFIVLEFVTLFAWFAVVVNIKDAINIMVSATADVAPQAVGVGQNVITGINVLFLFLVGLWIVLYLVWAHQSVNETTFQTVPTRGIKKW